MTRRGNFQSHKLIEATNPPAVTIGPPRLGARKGMAGLPGEREPSGTCQRIVPADISMAVNVPQGGGAHGDDALWRTERCGKFRTVRRVAGAISLWLSVETVRGNS